MKCTGRPRDRRQLARKSPKQQMSRNVCRQTKLIICNSKSARRHTRVHAHTHTHTYTRTCTRTRMHACAHAHTHAHTHTHTHTCKHIPQPAQQRHGSPYPWLQLVPLQLPSPQLQRTRGPAQNCTGALANLCPEAHQLVVM